MGGNGEGILIGVGNERHGGFTKYLGRTGKKNIGGRGTIRKLSDGLKKIYNIVGGGRGGCRK